MCQGGGLPPCKCTENRGEIDMITTLTLSPAFDVHVSMEEFLPEHENLAQSVSRDVGGKGINIARALLENGVDNQSVVLVGMENEADFCRGLKEVGLNCKVIRCPGRIRENITIHPAVGAETRLSFKGFSCEASVLEQVEACIGDSRIVTFTGSLPGGISSLDAEAFLLRLKEAGVQLVIDSKSISLPMLRRIKPWLIKPNEEEIAAYFGKEMDEECLKEKAMELHREGIANVMISLGGDGAILASEGKLYRAYVPKIRVASTIGAGDSAIAGFVSGGETPEERLLRAVSFGSAACLREGTNPPFAKDVEEIASQVRIEEV